MNASRACDKNTLSRLCSPRNDVEQMFIIYRTRVTMSEKHVPSRRYTKEFKVEAARMANSVGHNDAARCLGVPAITMGNCQPNIIPKHTPTCSRYGPGSPGGCSWPTISETEI